MSPDESLPVFEVKDGEWVPADGEPAFVEDEQPVEAEAVEGEPVEDEPVEVEGEEDPMAEIEAEIEALSEEALTLIEARCREVWLAEFNEKAQADLTRSFFPKVIKQGKGKKRTIAVESIGDLRFHIEGSDTLFYLDEQHPGGSFLLRVWAEG